MQLRRMVLYCVLMLLMCCTSHTSAETSAAQTGTALLIAIDPGHPSETSGGCAHHELKEVDICWQVAGIKEFDKNDTMVSGEP